MNMSRAFSDSEITKLKQIINEGIQVTSEVETLKGGLKDTVSAVAEELDMKPATINKAIRIAYKQEFAKVSDDFSELEELLAAVGKGH
jgi:hypothetical protein